MPRMYLLLVKLKLSVKKRVISSTARIDLLNYKKNNQDRVSDIAKSTPGVFVEHGGARNEYNLLVRGFNARRVPVFMDGIPVYVPYDGEMDLGRFTTFDLSRIDISKGASSVLYGANTMGGAVNLISKTNSTLPKVLLAMAFHTVKVAAQQPIKQILI